MKTKHYLFCTICMLLISACGAEKQPQNEVPEVKIEAENINEKWEEFKIDALGNTMPEMKYSVKSISVKEGSWVRIILSNKGVGSGMLHNIAFIKYGTRDQVAKEAIGNFPSEDFAIDNENIIAYSKVAKPGETVTLEFKSPAAGNYEFLCTYPGHAEIMRGYFFVK